MHLLGLIYLNVWWCTDLQTPKLIDILVPLRIMPQGKLRAFYLTAKSLWFKNWSKIVSSIGAEVLWNRATCTWRHTSLSHNLSITFSNLILLDVSNSSYVLSLSLNVAIHFRTNVKTDLFTSSRATHHFPPLVEVACHSHCVVFLPRHFDGLFLACHIAGHLLRVLASHCRQCPATSGRYSAFSMGPFLSWYVLGHCGSSYDALFIFEKVLNNNHNHSQIIEYIYIYIYICSIIWLWLWLLFKTKYIYIYI